MRRSFDELRNVFGDRTIMPGDTGYDEARALFYTWNNRRPAAIVRPVNATEVSRVVSFAREEGVELAVRSGGHSLGGQSVSEGGITLDLSRLKAIEIDPKTRTAWVESGMTAGQYTVATGAHGLATGFGDTGSVGIGGITLGGGVGFLVRKYGLTIDSLLAADIVTADGQLVRTDAQNHPDLFWAIRGGGGNFGVVTRFRFQLHEVDKVLGGILMLPATPEVIRRFMEESEAAPEELSIIMNVMTAPPMPFIPKEQVGQLMIMALMVCTGPLDSAERIVARFRSLAKPLADMVRPMHYPEMYAGPEGPHPVAGSVRCMFMDSFDQSAAEAIVGRIGASKATMAVAQLRVLGGAAARVPEDATAYAHRNRRIMVNVAALYERPGDASVHNAWVEKFAADLRRGGPGVYVNFLGNEGADRVREAYPGETWKRLVSVKRRYDPHNLFRSNQNIPAEADVRSAAD